MNSATNAAEELKLLTERFGFFPCQADKRPDVRRAGDHNRFRHGARPTHAECEQWAGGMIGLWAGENGLGVIDIDDDTLYEPFLQAVEDHGLESVLDRCAIVKTPHGHHLCFAVAEIKEGSQKLACWTSPRHCPARGKDVTVRIETRAVGGYAIVPPSPGYTYVRGSLLELGPITLEEWADLCAVARLFDERQPKPAEPVRSASNGNGNGLRPGDDYNERGPTVLELLLDHGWQQIGRAVGGRTAVRRPGKPSGGLSGTVTADGQLFYCFSTNAVPFEADRSYSAFGILTMLDHGGDYRAAAKALATQGYGLQPGPGGESASAGATQGEPTTGTDQGRNEDKAPLEFLEDILGRMGAECWRDEDRRPLITLRMAGKLRHAEIGSSACDDLLSRAFYLERKKPLSDQTLAAACRQLRARALFDGETKDRARRIAASEHEVYLALLDDEQRVVRATASGWELVTEDACSIRFVRESGALPLPVPVPGGDLPQLLSKVINVEQEHLPLVSAFLVGVFLPVGTMPVLAASGQQGSGKTCGTRTLRGLVDPQVGGMQRLPKDPGALMAVVNAADVLAFDNISKISEELSDCLCSIASGIALDARKLYTNKELERVHARKPLILNGIGDIVSRPDLMERALFVTFRTLPEAERRSERELQKQIEALRPQLLGAILDRVCRALREQDEIANPGVRLNDFGRWALAASADHDERQQLARALTDNRERLQVATIDNDEFAQALIAWVEELGEVTMSATQILNTLNAKREASGRRIEGWPTRPEAVGKALARLAPTLRGVGIEITQLPRSGRARPWHLRAGGELSQLSQPSLASPSEPMGGCESGDGSSDSDRQRDEAASPSDSLFEPDCDRYDGRDSLETDDLQVMKI